LPEPSYDGSVTRARWSGLVVVLALLGLPAAGAQAAECPAGSPTPVFTVNGKATGPVYTTHDLTVRVKLSGGAYYSVDSLNVTGIRRVPLPDDNELPFDEAYGIADAPGTLTATATLTNDDANCTVSGTANFEVQQATAPLVSRLRRPPPFKGHRGWVWDSKFWFWVKPGPTGAVTPITVVARAIRRARVPGPGVPAKRITFPMRPSDWPPPERDSHGDCSAYDLICPPRVRTWPKGAEVEVTTKGGREVPALVKVLVTLPRGIPTLHYSIAKTPIGLDVKLLQDGSPIARLRMAGRCAMEGQFSKCRFKKLSTAL
jgi:hypothetical protein